MSHWYAPDWVPYGAAPEVKSLEPEAHALLMRRALLRSLDATMHLETRIVNPVARWISEGGQFDASTRQAAERLFAEEEQHAEAANEMRERAMVPGYVPAEPAFAARLEHRVRTSKLPEFTVRFLFVWVTETTLSARLAEHDASTGVREDVRQLLANHARDERWHARFFARCGSRELAAGRPDTASAREELPHLVAAYVDPDIDVMESDLEAVGLSKPEVLSTRQWLEAHVGQQRAPHLQRALALLTDARHAEHH